MGESTGTIQDAPKNAYARWAVIDASARASIVEANVGFLSLLASRPLVADSFGLPAGVLADVRSLDPSLRFAVADCPYTLFDLGFADARLWRELAATAPAVAPVETAPVGRFARSAVFLGWHLAQSNELAAALALGMSTEVQRIWRGLSVSALEDAARAATPRLRARWGQHPTFWPKLLAHPPGTGRELDDSVRLLGVQLIAADGVWPAPPGAGRASPGG